MVGEEILEEVARGLVPPGMPRNPRFKFDLTVAGSIVVLFIIGGFHMAWACNWLVGFGLMGFAPQSEAIELQHKQQIMASEMRRDTNDLKVLVISGQILSLYSTKCSAERSKNIQLAENIGEQLSTLEVVYMRLNSGQSYPLQPCP